MPSWGIRYEAVDFQLSPANAFFGVWPEEEIRLQLDGYKPAAIFAGSFVLYWFILLPFVFPATRPTSEAGKKALNSVRDVHNIFLCVYSGIACFGTLYYLYTHNLLNYHDFLCAPLEGTPIRLLSVTFTISKIWEWVDTAFIVWLGNRPPGFLHTYHHATTFWLFCFVMNQPGSEKSGLVFNGFVHFLMYSHYFRSWPKALVPLITILQIAQLVASLTIYTVNANECPEADFAEDANNLSIEFLSSYATVPVFIFFFVKFFINRWIFPAKKDTDAKKAK